VDILVASHPHRAANQDAEVRRPTLADRMPSQEVAGAGARGGSWPIASVRWGVR